MLPELVTPRLRLRSFCDADREPFARLNADPRVMEYYPKTLSRVESDAMVDRIAAHVLQHGFGLWAIELAAERRFIGYVGFAVPTFTAAFTPCIEIGWRLAPDAWGQGYATEGALRALAYGFAELAFPEVVSFTTVGNARSRRVMTRLGMQHDPAFDFEHPALPPGHLLRPHVLYRLPQTSQPLPR